MPIPRSPPRLNLTGMVLPAFAMFRVGRLSTGEKKPVNGEMDLIVPGADTLGR